MILNSIEIHTHCNENKRELKLTVTFDSKHTPCVVSGNSRYITQDVGGQANKWLAI